MAADFIELIGDPKARTSWDGAGVTSRILGQVPESGGLPIPTWAAKICARRVSEMRNQLSRLWIGLEDEHVGHPLDWILAALIARENVLLLGPPGVAKTEIAVQLFEMLGLGLAESEENIPNQPLADARSVSVWWKEREALAAGRQKYFRYLLSRFTQPEELFGPIEIDLLRQGILARVNFGLLTGPGVRAAFLDEIFKASSSILNTLLTLTQERQYFNWGGMVPSDLVMFVGASNEMPGGFESAAFGLGSGGDDFQMLYAFLDRFPVRIQIQIASGESTPDEPHRSDLVLATDLAVKREAARFCYGDAYRSDQRKGVEMPVINDILLLGRALLQQELDRAQSLFAEEPLRNFTKHFRRLAADLARSNTSPEMGVNWTVSPRKLKALYKIALAHALVTDEGFARGDKDHKVAGPTPEQLKVFNLIWDSPLATAELWGKVDGEIEDLRGSRTWSF